MTNPIDQAEAILKAAEVLALDQKQVSADDKWSEYELQTRRRLDGIPSIASALIEKHKALEEAEAHIQILLDIFEPIPGSETSLDDKRMIREARAFLSRISKEQDNG